MPSKARVPRLIAFIIRLHLLVFPSFVACFRSNPMLPLTTTSSPTSIMLSSNESTTTHSETTWLDSNPRSCILQVGVSAGRLCGVANSHLLFNDAAHNNTALVLAMTDMLLDLYRTSQSLDLNLVVAIYNKLELNRRKYPVDLCKGKAGKYTQYSQVTGVTVDNQSTTSADQEHERITLVDFVAAIPRLVEDIQTFAEERDWTRFHTPRNIILALLGEIGELAELVQWKGDEPKVLALETKELDKLSQELADVSIYLLRLASVTNVTSELVENLDFVEKQNI